MTDNRAEPTEYRSTAEQRILLARLLAGEIHEQNFFPLSYAQERLWYLDRAPNSPPYNMLRPAHLIGKLDVLVLQQSINEVVRRQGSLRTTFAAVRGQPVQMVTPTLTVMLPMIDLQDCPAEKREAEVYRLAIAEWQREFNLVRGPLFRATLLRLGPEEHILLLGMRYIISDGWSWEVFIKETGAFYQALVSGTSVSLPKLPLQYADYSSWQREWLQGERLEEQLAYWKEQLRDAPPRLNLPTDWPRPPVQNYSGQWQVRMLPERLVKSLKALSEQEEVTLFMTLLGAFKIVLFQYTDQADILVGTPLAGRNRAELAALIGSFVNILVLRTNLSGNPSFRELLKRMREVIVKAYAHQDLPLGILFKELKIKREPGRSPLFQVFVNMLTFQHEQVEFSDLRVEPLPLPYVEARFDFQLNLQERGDQFQVELVYNHHLFKSERIIRLLEQYQAVLEQVVANPECPIADLPFPADLSHPHFREGQDVSSIELQPVTVRRQPQGSRGPFSGLLPMQTGKSDDHPLFLIPPAGGSSLCYTSLTRYLGSDLPVYGLQAQGLDGKQDLLVQVEAMASSYLELIRSIQPQGPYQLGGWSFGGIVAFEMAQHLQAEGQRVALLALIDSQAPAGEKEPDLDESTYLGLLALGWGMSVEQLASKRERIARLEPVEQLASLVEEATQSGVLPLNVTLEQIRRQLHLLKTNIRAGRRYVPRPYPGAIIGFTASTPAASLAGVEHLGWGAWATQGMTTHTIPGTHFTILREPQVQVLAEKLKHYLCAPKGAGD